MTYADVSLVVEGALDNQSVAYTETDVDEYVQAAEAEAKADGLHTEVYVLWHEHDETNEECACVQYLTDHHPYASFNNETGS
jgi:hypothetical protein